MSSDEDYDSSHHNERREKQLPNLTSILFGNIDSNGNLVDDIFDDECKRHLSSLQRHLSSIIPFNDMVDEDEDIESGVEEDANKDVNNCNSGGEDSNHNSGQNGLKRDVFKRSDSVDSSYCSQSQPQSQSVDKNDDKSDESMNCFIDN